MQIEGRQLPERLGTSRAESGTERLARHRSSALKTQDRSARLLAQLLDSGASTGTARELVIGQLRDSVSKSLAAVQGVLPAAISLGHEEFLGAMVDELASVQASLGTRSTFESRSRHRRTNVSARQASALKQWWFQLSEATEVVGREIDVLRTVAAGRKRESTSRRLCAVVVRVLRNHYNRLSAESESWMI